MNNSEVVEPKSENFLVLLAIIVVIVLVGIGALFFERVDDGEVINPINTFNQDVINHVEAEVEFKADEIIAKAEAEAIARLIEANTKADAILLRSRAESENVRIQIETKARAYMDEIKNAHERELLKIKTKVVEEIERLRSENELNQAKEGFGNE